MNQKRPHPRAFSNLAEAKLRHKLHPHILLRKQRHRHRLRPPDIRAVLANGSIRREHAGPGAVQDRHAGPVVAVEVGGAGAVVGVGVRGEVGEQAVGVVVDEAIDQGAEQFAVAATEVAVADQVDDFFQFRVAIGPFGWSVA